MWILNGMIIMDEHLGVVPGEPRGVHLLAGIEPLGIEAELAASKVLMTTLGADGPGTRPATDEPPRIRLG